MQHLKFNTLLLRNFLSRFPFYEIRDTGFRSCRLSLINAYMSNYYNVVTVCTPSVFVCLSRRLRLDVIVLACLLLVGVRRQDFSDAQSSSFQTEVDGAKPDFVMKCQLFLFINLSKSIFKNTRMEVT